MVYFFHDVIQAYNKQDDSKMCKWELAFRVGGKLNLEMNRILFAWNIVMLTRSYNNIHVTEEKKKMIDNQFHTNQSIEQNWGLR